jgi:hypothetical protein
MSKNEITAFIEAVKKEAEGSWRFIYGNLCPSMSLAVAMADKRRNGHVPDPITGLGKDRFRLLSKWEYNGGGILNPDQYLDGWELLMRCNGWDFMTSINEVAGLMRIERSKFGFGDYKAKSIVPKAKIVEEVKIDYEAIEKHKTRMINTWKSSYPLTHPESALARKYLASRGIINIERLRWVRFNPKCFRFYEAEEGEQRHTFEPAIICAMQDVTGKTINLHRTYLTKDGTKGVGDGVKAPMLTPAGYTVSGTSTLIGCDSNGELPQLVMVCEGLETAASIWQQYKVPVLACHTAVNMLNVDLPNHVTKVIIMADRDVSNTGQRIAIKLKDALISEGKQAVWGQPGKETIGGPKGADWNDTLMEGAKWPSLQIMSKSFR